MVSQSELQLELHCAQAVTASPLDTNGLPVCGNMRRVFQEKHSADVMMASLPAGIRDLTVVQMGALLCMSQARKYPLISTARTYCAN